MWPWFWAAVALLALAAGAVDVATGAVLSGMVAAGAALACATQAATGLRAARSRPLSPGRR